MIKGLMVSILAYACVLLLQGPGLAQAAEVGAGVRMIVVDQPLLLADGDGPGVGEGTGEPGGGEGVGAGTGAPGTGEGVGEGTGAPAGGSIPPPGAAELPAPFLFGAGFIFFGFGILAYRKLW